MASELVLIVAADPHNADRYAEALLPAGPFAFAFARDSVSALAHAASLHPALAIISLEGVEGIELCRGFRQNPETADVRLLLVLERDQLAAARGSVSNGVVVEPTSPLAITGEALNALRRRERRSLDRPDRRTLPRGGRRVTDVSPTDPLSATLAE